MSACAARWSEREFRTGSWIWKGWEVAVLVLGFVLFWPIGLAMLVWKYWRMEKGGRMPDVSRFMGPAGRAYRMRPTGNLAFDDYRAAELDRLERERQRLVEEEKAFAEFMERLKRARDKEEFDRFMAERSGPAAA